MSKWALHESCKALESEGTVVSSTQITALQSLVQRLPHVNFLKVLLKYTQSRPAFNFRGPNNP